MIAPLPVPAVLQPRHPGWPPGELPRFSDWYEVLASVSIPVVGRTPKRRFLGCGAPRRCCLCGRGAPTASFKSRSHVIPAALGNRHLFTLEECDSCNATYSSWEGDLADLLAPQRILGATRSRRGRPKISLRGMSSIEAVSPNEIRIIQDSRDDSIRLDVANETGALTLTCPPHRPLGAALTLLRSLWLILDSKHRARLPQLLRAITSGAAPNTQLFRFSTPGMKLPNAVLTAWTKRTPGTVAGATFVLQFSFIDTVLTWLWEDEDGKRSASLLPPILGFAESTRSGEYLQLSTDHWIENSTVTYSFAFDSQAPLPPTDAEGTRDPGNHRPSLPVLLETVSPGGKFVLASKLEIEASPGSGQRLLVRGEEWPGYIIFQTNADATTGSFELAWFPHSMTPRDALKSAEFLHGLRDSRSVSLLLASSGSTILRANLDSDHVLGTLELPLLRDLALINSAFGVDIRIPKRITDAFLSEVTYVASVLKTGSAPVRSGKATFTLHAEDPSTLEREVREALSRTSPPSLLIHKAVVTGTIENTELPLGECSREFEVTSIQATRTGVQTMVIEAEFSRATDVYSSWKSLAQRIDVGA